MRILIATDNFYPNVNGAARFTYMLAKGLTEAGHNIYIAAPSKKFKYTFAKHDGITIYGIPSIGIPKIIHPSGIRIPLPLTIDPATIRELLKKVNPDVIHIQDHFVIGDMIAKMGRKLGIPQIGTNHFMPENFIHYLHPPDFAKKPLSRLAWKQFISVYKQLNLVTTPTKTAAGLIENLGLKSSVIPISCGVDLNKFSPNNNGDYLKKRYQIIKSKPVVLFVGRLDKEKNIDLVIEAFSNALASLDAHLVIVGKGKEKQNLIKLAQNLGISKNVTFTGFVSDKELPFVYRIADVFVIASTAELQSIATMEAMASGLPVIATNVLALPELVHPGKNGYLFTQGDLQTSSNQLVKILQNPLLKKRMSKNSLKIISHHKLSNTIKSYEKLYQKLISTSKI